MPYAKNGDIALYYEEAGTGHPIVFVHEFAADCREWEPQLRFFSRDYRCVAFNARGYPPSDVPGNDEAYGYDKAIDDIAAVIRHLGVSQAHVVGLSMGAYATLLFGLRHPGLASALVVAGVGAGSPPGHRDEFRKSSRALAEQFRAQGSAAVASEYGVGPTRVQLQNKDPRAWAEFARHFAEHSAEGSAMTMRNVQATRPSLYDFADELRRMTLPVLLVVGDEDEPCLDTSLFLKRTMPSAGLWVFPRTGHMINLEEPAAFNRVVQDFFGTVERGRWGPRDPRAAVPR